MIIEIAEATGVGAAFFLGWITKHFIAKSRVVKELLAYDNVYKFEPLNNYHCPKCGLDWCNESKKFCECYEHCDGHFHMRCNGTRNSKKDVGCGAEWIMLSKK